MFYHSIDSRPTTYEQHQLLLRHQQKKFLEQQQKLNQYLEITHEPKKQTPPAVLSQPFNGSKQIQAVSDIFKPVESEQQFEFDRLNVNQLSTKSQPGRFTHYQKEMGVDSGSNGGGGVVEKSTASTVSSVSASSSSVTSVENQPSGGVVKSVSSYIISNNPIHHHHHQHLNQRILQHPAHV